MQNSDGSVLSKVAVSDFQNASHPVRIRHRLSTARHPLPRRSRGGFVRERLRGLLQCRTNGVRDHPAERGGLRMELAVANPSVTFSMRDSPVRRRKVSAYERSMYKLCAAIFLYEATGDAAYKTYVEANYTAAQPMQWTYWYGFEAPLQDALIHYQHPGWRRAAG